MDEGGNVGGVAIAGTITTAISNHTERRMLAEAVERLLASKKKRSLAGNNKTHGGLLLWADCRWSAVQWPLAIISGRAVNPPPLCRNQKESTKNNEVGV